MVDEAGQAVEHALVYRGFDGRRRHEEVARRAVGAHDLAGAHKADGKFATAVSHGQLQRRRQVNDLFASFARNPHSTFGHVFLLTRHCPQPTATCHCSRRITIRRFWSIPTCSAEARIMIRA
jgi:hypothetical protein